MKKIKILLFSMLLVVLLTGCVDSEVYEVDVITLRVYSETEQSGVFSTKENTYCYIEYTYEFMGELHVDREKTQHIDVGNETKVIVDGRSDGYVYYTNIQLSMDDYKKYYGMEEK